ncbi:hypothetical protein VT84_13985 [Gemmata sp. SH-PL17]|uniref:hypothetical protein n=1 Tax=Gemmata sp. SH-PL17 TaxID=1630693 RepID=UPI00078DAE5F|nr:hypothetical protein [Gemmata sp. SH-PL17]AMV24607.1 hypothetical protein VT84_09440 [Gemmata sp. SH-PL17]AMV25504.1 hypothetical protein VT84_13985 [Gemmata sp. SH-PL17]
MKGFIRVWGGELSETQQCEIDSHGNFCGGAEVPDQGEIESQITSGQRSGKTESGVRWEYR